MGRWPAILDSRRASFEKEWSKKGIFWRWPHHFWLLRNSCKSRKGKKMRYTNVRTRDQNVEKTYISVVVEIVQNLFPWHAHCAKNVIYGKEIILPWSLVTPGKKRSRNQCVTPTEECQKWHVSRKKPYFVANFSVVVVVKKLTEWDCCFGEGFLSANYCLDYFVFFGKVFWTIISNTPSRSSHFSFVVVGET